MVSWKSVLALDFPHAAVAFGAAFLAGAINSVAGGGTLVSFPALIWLGLGSVTANATSTVAIWPGTVGSTWGYRREFADGEPPFAPGEVAPPVADCAQPGGRIDRRAVAALDAASHLRPHGAVPDPVCHPAVHGPGTRTADVEDGWALRTSVGPLVCRDDVVSIDGGPVWRLFRRPA